MIDPSHESSILHIKVESNEKSTREFWGIEPWAKVEKWWKWVKFYLFLILNSSIM